MSRLNLGRSLAGLLRSVAGAACGCGARAWSTSAERNLGGVIMRAEIRSR
jgi:hypothetical protein